jgi:hypothetical protein
MSYIYLDNHEALSITGEIKPNGKIHTLRAILDEEESSGLTWAIKKSTDAIPSSSSSMPVTAITITSQYILL